MLYRRIQKRKFMTDHGRWPTNHGVALDGLNDGPRTAAATPWSE